MFLLVPSGLWITKEMETPLFSDLEIQLQQIIRAVVNLQTLEPPAWTLTKTDGPDNSSTGMLDKQIFHRHF